MGTLRVDNLQKEDGSAVITDGTINGTLSETTLRNSGVKEIKLATASASSSSTISFDNTVFTSNYKSYVITANDFVLSTNAVFRFADAPDNGSTFSFTSKMGNW